MAGKQQSQGPKSGLRGSKLQDLNHAVTRKGHQRLTTPSMGSAPDSQCGGLVLSLRAFSSKSPLTWSAPLSPLTVRQRVLTRSSGPSPELWSYKVLPSPGRIYVF